MFENYQNLSTQYTPNNYQNGCVGNTNLQSVSPNKPFEVMDAAGNLIGYFWYYGNSVVLSFEISGEYVSGNDTYVDAADVLKDCMLTFTMYDNVRHNIVHQESKQARGSSVDFMLDAEISNKIKKGKYTAQLVASNSLGYNETLFGSDTCIFEVR